MIFAILCFPVTMRNTNQKQLGEESPSSGKLWHLEAGTAAEAMEEHCLLACSSWLLGFHSFITQDHLPRGGPTVSWSLPH